VAQAGEADAAWAEGHARLDDGIDIATIERSPRISQANFA
jgi:hypothetical protein